MPDEQNSIFLAEEIINIKLLAGVRYFIYQKRRTEVATRVKFGPIIPANNRENAELGYLYGIDLALFQKMSKRHSIETELFWEHYKQDYASISMARMELGLRLSYIFRM